MSGDANSHASGALRIVLLYAGFSSLWILCSDNLTLLLFSDPHQVAWVSMIKGWLFVAVTSLLLFALIRRSHRQMEDSLQAQWGAQREKTRAIQLLETIAANTTDIVLSRMPMDATNSSIPAWPLLPVGRSVKFWGVTIPPCFLRLRWLWSVRMIWRSWLRIR